MNDQLPPMAADQVLELLSAEIDGEFDAAATDLGLTPADARARLDATPGVTEQRAALTATRTALAVPALDDATRERLVSTALQSPAASDELSTRRARRTMGRVIGIAATIAAVVVGAGALAVVAGDSDDDGGGDAAMTAEAPAADEESADDSDSVEGDAGPEAAEDDAASDSERGTAGALVAAPAPYSYFLDFGDVTNPVALQAAVAGQLQSLAERTARAGTGLPLTDAPTTAFAYDIGCYAEFVADYGLTPPPVMAGTATYAGDDVQVVVFTAVEGYEAFVLTAECEVLDDQFVTP